MESSAREKEKRKKKRREKETLVQSRGSNLGTPKSCGGMNNELQIYDDDYLLSSSTNKKKI